jgi:replicative DNA helicase
MNAPQQKKSGASDSYLKVPPQDIEIEQAILGACMIWPDARMKVKAHLTPQDFYREAHAAIFDAMCSMKGECDANLIKVELEKKGLLENIGGVEYLVNLVEQTITKAGLDHYCQVILDCSTRRRIIQAGTIMAEKGFERFTETAEIISAAKESIRGLNAHEEKAYREGVELMKAVYNEIERKVESQNRMVGISWGIDKLDEVTGGAEPKTLTYICGRPSMGKTALALHMADHMASLKQGPVLYFSHEMGAEALTRRRIASNSGVYLSRIRSGSIEPGQWDWLIRAFNELSDRQFVIVDHSRFKDIGALVALTETLAMERKPAAVYVDHIQLMRARGRWTGRHPEISFISAHLKELAKDLSIPVIALCQLSRDLEKRPVAKQRPILPDLKESGDLEQDGDVIMGIYRKTKESREMELGGMKGRDIGTWAIDLIFDRFTQRIMEPKDEPEQDRYNREE